MNKPTPYKGPEPYIFISYAHKDSDRVWPIIDRMLKDGYRVWYDEGIDPGTEWNKRIAAKLSHCSRFIVFLTRNSIASKFVRREINFADRKDKPLLQIYLEDLTLPEDLELTLDDYQAIFWHAYSLRDEAFEKLYETEDMQACHTGTAVSEEFSDVERRYREGWSLFYDDEDYERAIEVLLPLAKQGHADAQFALAGCYAGLDESRILSPFDLADEEALWWYRHAAEQGHAGAQTVMGLYFQYNATSTNLLHWLQRRRKAVYWYRLAARQEDDGGCYYLARCYQKGIGVKKDLDRALFWYRKANGLGHEKAQKCIDRMLFRANILPPCLYPLSGDAGSHYED